MSKRCISFAERCEAKRNNSNNDSNPVGSSYAAVPNLTNEFDKLVFSNNNNNSNNNSSSLQADFFANPNNESDIDLANRNDSSLASNLKKSVYITGNNEFNHLDSTDDDSSEASSAPETPRSEVKVQDNIVVTARKPQPEFIVDHQLMSLDGYRTSALEGVEDAEKNLARSHSLVASGIHTMEEIAADIKSHKQEQEQNKTIDKDALESKRKILGSLETDLQAFSETVEEEKDNAEVHGKWVLWHKNTVGMWDREIRDHHQLKKKQQRCLATGVSPMHCAFTSNTCSSEKGSGAKDDNTSSSGRKPPANGSRKKSSAPYSAVKPRAIDPQLQLATDGDDSGSDEDTCPPMPRLVLGKNNNSNNVTKPPTNSNIPYNVNRATSISDNSFGNSIQLNNIIAGATAPTAATANFNNGAMATGNQNSNNLTCQAVGNANYVPMFYVCENADSDYCIFGKLEVPSEFTPYLAYKMVNGERIVDNSVLPGRGVHGVKTKKSLTEGTLLKDEVGYRSSKQYRATRNHDGKCGSCIIPRHFRKIRQL